MTELSRSHARRRDLHQDVAVLLDAFESEGPAPRAGTRARALVRRGPAVTRRDHVIPGHFTASAIILSPDVRSVLLVLHRKLGIWCQPGGHFEFDDSSVEEAARRECAEEVGLVHMDRIGAGLFNLDIHPIPAWACEPAHEHFDLRLLFHARTWDLEVRAEVLDARWFALDAAQDVADASLRRALNRLPDLDRT